MKKTLLAILLAVALIVIPVGNALAATTQDVTINATPGWVSISIVAPDPDSFDFGVVLAGVDENTSNGYFIITNDSTVLMDLSIECLTWSAVLPGNDWNYGDPASGDDTARLFASSAEGNGAGLYDIALLTTGGTLLCNAVPTATDPTFELQLDVPNAFTFVDAQETTVTLTATVD